MCQAQQHAQGDGACASGPLRIAFLHPDLGLGGAERLVVDAAVELASRGHTVDMYTSHHDRSRCFEETTSGHFAVLVAGAWFPRFILGRLGVPCAWARCLLAAIYVLFCAWRSGEHYHVIIVDQVSIALPLLRLAAPRSRLLFYCHFPDKLLFPHTGAIYRAYRVPLNWLEEVTTGAAHEILVNSAFTAAAFRRGFPRLAARGLQPAVLHPAVSIPSDQALADAAAAWADELPLELAAFASQGRGPLFLSINRFERKKGIGLALRALAELLQRRPGCDARLIIAGGYDVRQAENVEHLVELQREAKELQLEGSVRFLPSFSDRQRALLLAACTAVLYTPPNEHFGIVPLEAMAAGRPVVACNSGGPTESVPHGSAGLLCEPTAGAWASAMAALLDVKAADRMGAAAQAHVRSGFARDVFGSSLEAVVRQLAAGE